MADGGDAGGATLKRPLGAWSLVALGIGAIIGAGLFVRTAAAIAQRAGPSVTIAFIVAGIGCAFAGLCYAEFASMTLLKYWLHEMATVAAPTAYSSTRSHPMIQAMNSPIVA